MCIRDSPETVKEEVTPVIEVHEPHEGVHSWKDALIHIAIIVVGLLIAPVSYTHLDDACV